MCVNRVFAVSKFSGMVYKLSRQPVSLSLERFTCEREEEVLREYTTVVDIHNKELVQHLQEIVVGNPLKCLGRILPALNESPKLEEPENRPT